MILLRNLYRVNNKNFKSIFNEKINSNYANDFNHYTITKQQHEDVPEKSLGPFKQCVILFLMNLKKRCCFT